MFTTCLNTHYFYDKTDPWVMTDGRKDVVEQAGGGEQHNITEAGPNELKLGEGG